MFVEIECLGQGRNCDDLSGSSRCAARRDESLLRLIWRGGTVGSSRGEIEQAVAADALPASLLFLTKPARR